MAEKTLNFKEVAKDLLVDVVAGMFIAVGIEQWEMNPVLLCVLVLVIGIVLVVVGHSIRKRMRNR